MSSFRHSTEIYDRLKDMLSPVILSQYGVIPPSLQNPTLHLNEFIKSLFGTDKDFINPPSQELLRILYKYKYGTTPSDPQQILTVKLQGATYVVGIPDKKRVQMKKK